MQTQHPLSILSLVTETVRAMKPLVEKVHRHEADLARQIRRAMNSVGLNLAEALGSDAGNRRARLHTALGSVREVRMGLSMAAGWGHIDEAEARVVDAKLDRIAARTYGLLRR
jgi:four helix bundle protein